LLESAKGRLGPLGGWLSVSVELADPESFETAVAEARAGIASMVSAAGLAQNSGEDTAATLNALAGQARTPRTDPSGLDALDLVVLATEQNATADGGGSILTAAEMARAAQLLDGMPAAQRQQFEELLAGAKSPAEAAYLMKALAAGNSLAAIQEFDKLIHPYGDNLAWLSQHLAPDVVNGSYDGKSGVILTIKGVSGSLYMPVYSQGVIAEDCVAASTVAALANLDPVYMLQLTTGDHPGVPALDTPTALYHRLQSAYISNYEKGEVADGVRDVTSFTNAAIKTPGENLITNSLIGRATGTVYQYVPLNGSSDNQAMLPQVEQAVAAGQPVPIDVAGSGRIGHQMVIIGSSGNNLQIYEPESGHAYWVTTQQFVNNQLGDVTGVPDGLPTATGLEMQVPTISWPFS